MAEPFVPQSPYPSSPPSHVSFSPHLLAVLLVKHARRVIVLLFHPRDEATSEEAIALFPQINAISTRCHGAPGWRWHTHGPKVEDRVVVLELNDAINSCEQLLDNVSLTHP